MSYKIIGKYIKDLKFNIPNPKAFFLLSKNISNYRINIDIKSDQVKENIIEVLTSLSLTTAKNNSEKIDTKIIFAAIVELNNKNSQKKRNRKNCARERSIRYLFGIKKNFYFFIRKFRV